MKKPIFIIESKEIKRDGNILKIDDKKLPLSMVEVLYIFNSVNISHSARNLLLKHSKSIFYFDRKCQLQGILTPPTFKSDIHLRLKQYENRHNAHIANYIILKKIEAIEKFAQRSLDRYKIKLEGVESMEIILGIEGSATLHMFSKFRNRLEAVGIDEFKKREYRPVKDRVNALLSFLYTMYYSFVFAQLIKDGFDPYFSFLHKKRGAHATLASDVMEPARVELTALALDILPKIYSDGFKGVYLDFKEKQLVCKEFAKFLANYENTLIKEIKGMLC